VPEFQFLVGRLKMHSLFFVQLWRPVFQFLVGRLKILSGPAWGLVLELFQFLVGRLKIRAASKDVLHSGRVSIPRR